MSKPNPIPTDGYACGGKVKKAAGGMIEGYACGGKVKKADGGMVGCHNPDNRLPKHAMHVRGRNRGM